MENAYTAFESAFGVLEFTLFGIPFYVILIGIALVAAVFKLLSNKKNNGGE